MVAWSVKGRGAEVTVVSPEGDVYPFVITSVDKLELKLCATPTWQGGREPRDADLKIFAAHGAASRWTSDTFGTSA